jgi:hypothetical protein
MRSSDQTREIIFERQSDGTFKQEGEAEFKDGRFFYFKEDRWQGGWAVLAVSDLMGWMQHEPGLYKYSQYKIIEDRKPSLTIHPCCTSCGLPGDVSRPYNIDADALPSLPPNGSESAEVLKWWEEEKEQWTGSPFFNASVGQSVRSCYDTGEFETNAYGQIVATGVSGQFCSPFCLAMGMFLPGRCAGCSKRLPKAAGRRYQFCKACEPAKEQALAAGLLTIEHVKRVLGMSRAATVTRPCVVCGTPFLAERADAKCCSSKCRNKASYRRGHRGNAKPVERIPIDTFSSKSALITQDLQG